MLGIFGAGRNGSTLLMRLLDGSPDLWIYPIELRWLEVRESAAKESCAFADWVRRQQEELREVYLSRLEETLQPAAEIAVEGETPEERLRSYLVAVRRAYAPLTTPPDAMLGFKTIEVADPGRYGQLFPDLYFLHLVRDPFANYASLKRTDMVVKRKPFWFQGGDVLRTFLERRWLPHARFLLAARERDPRRHFVVRYESLTAEPARVVGEICDWLGVSPPPEADRQTVLGGRRLRELPNPAPEKPTANLRPVYDDVVTPREAELIRLATHSLAARLGYDVGSTGGRLRLARDWLPLDSWETMNVDSRLAQGKALLARRAYVYRKLLSP